MGRGSCRPTHASPALGLAGRGRARRGSSAIPSRRSAWASSITPPSDDRRPPSEAAVIFDRTAGNENGGIVWSVMADVVAADGWAGMASETEFCIISKAHTTSARLALCPS